eukprot:5743366-Amphidinium_carterae.1
MSKARKSWKPRPWRRTALAAVILRLQCCITLDSVLQTERNAAHGTGVDLSHFWAASPGVTPASHGPGHERHLQTNVAANVPIDEGSRVACSINCPSGCCH